MWFAELIRDSGALGLNPHTLYIFKVVFSRETAVMTCLVTVHSKTIQWKKWHVLLKGFECDIGSLISKASLKYPGSSSALYLLAALVRHSVQEGTEISKFC